MYACYWWGMGRFQSEGSCSKLDFQTLIIWLLIEDADDLRMKGAERREGGRWQRIESERSVHHRCCCSPPPYSLVAVFSGILCVHVFSSLIVAIHRLLSACSLNIDAVGDDIVIALSANDDVKARAHPSICAHPPFIRFAFLWNMHLVRGQWHLLSRSLGIPRWHNVILLCLPSTDWKLRGKYWHGSRHFRCSLLLTLAAV